MADPKYRHIAENLRAKIESGGIARGDRLPTEIELMNMYKASRNTVRDAMKLLTSLRLVETRAGQGTFALEKINPFINTLTRDPGTIKGDSTVYLEEAMRSGRIPENSEPRVEVQKADAAIAKELQIDSESEVVSRHQRRFMDGIPWSLQTSFYPMSLIESGATRLIQARDIPVGVMAYLANDLGIKQAGYSDTVEVRPPDETEATFFRLPPDGRIPVFAIFRIGFGEDNTPLRLTLTVLPTDRNRLRINVGKVPPDAGEPG